MVKRFIGLVCCLFIAGGLYFIWHQGAVLEKECAFCNSTILARQTFYEDPLVLGLYTHKPLQPGHCLIIPKRHVERFEQLTDEEVLAIGHLIKKIERAVSSVFGTSAYLILQKNGAEVGQTVPHVHVHFIPRSANETATPPFLWKFFKQNFQRPLSDAELEDNVERMRQALFI